MFGYHPYAHPTCQSGMAIPHAHPKCFWVCLPGLSAEATNPPPHQSPSNDLRPQHWIEQSRNGDSWVLCKDGDWLHLIELGQEGWRARAAYFFTCNICIHSYIVVDAYIHVFTYLYVYTCIHVHICTYIFICTDFHMPISTLNSVYFGGYICIDIFAFIYL